MNTKLGIIFIAFCLILSQNFGKANTCGNLFHTLKFKFCRDKAAISGTPSRTVHNFLRWYKQNEKKLILFPLKKRGHGDSSVYRVDFNAAEEYIRELDKSNLFSPAFLTSLRAYLNLCDSNFKVHPQNDFIARGFETNLVTKLLDDMNIMEHIDSVKLSYKSLPGNHADVSVKGPYSPRPEMFFKLTNYAGVWKIDSINGDFPKMLK